MLIYAGIKGTCGGNVAYILVHIPTKVGLNRLKISRVIGHHGQFKIHCAINFTILTQQNIKGHEN